MKAKRFLSILLVIILTFSLAAISIVNSFAAVDADGHYVPSANIRKTSHLLFYMPKDWYNDSLDIKEAGAYWWGGDDACGSVDGTSVGATWPGYKMQIADKDFSLFCIDFPMDNPDSMTPIVFNNFFDGGEATKNDDGTVTYAKSEAEYKAAKQVKDATASYYSEGDCDFYDNLCGGDFFALAEKALDNNDESFLGDFADNFFIHEDWGISMNFNNMVYVIDPSLTSENFQGKETCVGEWYFYYGDGEYGPLPNKAMAAELGMVKELIDFNFNYHIIDGNAVEITGFIGNKPTVDIPTTIENHTVTGIAFGAFKSCKDINSITIPNTVTYIGKYAIGYYYENSEYKKIKDLKIYGYRGSAAEEYAQANGFEFIAIDPSEFDYAITGESTIEITGYRGSDSTVDIPNLIKGYKVTSIAADAFKNCTNITSVTVSNNVISIGDFAFDYCTRLRTITIPDSVKSIGDGAFYNCKNLLEVNYTGTIDQWAEIDFKCDDSNPLYHAENLYINDNLIKKANFTAACQISNYAFVNCTSLENITISNNVANIGDYAFLNCQNLKSVTIPESVKQIGKSAFGYNIEFNKISNFTIFGYKGSAAETYAKNNGFTFKSLDAVEAKSVSLSKASVTLGVGEVYTLKATLNPANAVTNYTWSSSNTGVATVNSSGKITPKAVGTANITVKTSNGKTAACKVTVKKAPTSITLNKTAVTLGVGEAYTLTRILSSGSSSVTTWTSSNTSVATVSGGKITPKAVGTATITAKTFNGKTATCKVTVKKAPTSITLNKTAVTLGVGEAYTLTRTFPSGSSSITTWTSSNTSVATVSGGKITPKAVGTATITAKTFNGKTATCKVTVKKAPTSIKLNKTSITLSKGKTYTLTRTLSSGSSSVTTWTSSNTKVATVSKGVVTAKAKGTAIITAKTYNGKTATCKVTVK